MKFLKYTLFFILGVIALALITALFVPKEFHAEGSTVINKPVTEVYNYVKYLKNQQNYGVWYKMDPKMEQHYEGTDATVGFKYTWKSEEVGNGQQVITKLEENKRIDYDLFFEGGADANKSFITTEAVSENQTNVRWVVDGKMPYPFNLMGLCYDMNKDFEQNVQNLKQVLEKQ